MDRETTPFLHVGSSYFLGSGRKDISTSYLMNLPGAPIILKAQGLVLPLFLLVLTMLRTQYILMAAANYLNQIWALSAFDAWTERQGRGGKKLGWGWGDIIQELLFDLMFQHKRAQTANPILKAKHQDIILREIKATQDQEDADFRKPRRARCTDPTPKKGTDWSQQVRSPFARKIREIERLNSKTKKQVFSFEKDEQMICQLGWSDFEEKVERSTHQHLQKVRRKAREMRKQASLSIFTCGGGDQTNSQVGEQKIADLWGMVKGQHPSKFDKYRRVEDLAKDVKLSYVLKNAYIACLNSKKYRDSPQSSFTSQKLKSFVYLHQNQAKLSKAKLDDLLRNNYLLQ